LSRQLRFMMEQRYGNRPELVKEKIKDFLSAFNAFSSCIIPQPVRKRVPIFRRRQTGFPFVDLHKIMTVMISQLLSDLFDGKGSFGQVIVGLRDSLIQNILVQGYTAEALK
jgi:hypothetical protein